VGELPLTPTASVPGGRRAPLCLLRANFYS
jgi:hypothetical protein